MKKNLIIAGIIATLSIVAYGLLSFGTHKKEEVIIACPADVMMCPDGSTVARSGASCTFGICPKEAPRYQVQSVEEKAPPIATTTPKQESVSVPQEKKQTFISNVIETATSLFAKDKAPEPEISKRITNTTPPSPQTISTEKSPAQEERYSIKNGSIVTASGTPIYAIPQFSNVSSQEDTSSTHLVNAVPVPGAVPVNGIPGKFYLSENYFSGNETCRFANRIFILDTETNTRSLLYEENSTTLSQDDPRACNNEMYLLTAEVDSLILKYHTLDTNMTCESSWSEPEKTWYLKPSQIEQGTRRYYISPSLYAQAEKEEEDCRALLTGTSTLP
jgi:hypothetical protein